MLFLSYYPSYSLIRPNSGHEQWLPSWIELCVAYEITAGSIYRETWSLHYWNSGGWALGLQFASFVWRPASLHNTARLSYSNYVTVTIYQLRTIWKARNKALHQAASLAAHKSGLWHSTYQVNKQSPSACTLIIHTNIHFLCKQLAPQHPILRQSQLPHLCMRPYPSIFPVISGLLGHSQLKKEKKNYI